MAANMIRIQFEITQEELERAKPFIDDEKYRHYWAKQAFTERVNRMEGYDKKARLERIKSDAKYVQEMIDEGFLKIEVRK